MRFMFVWILVLDYCLETESGVGNSSCGWDGSPVSTVYEGVASITTYPWLGMLYYPMGHRRFTTSVVLVTRQIVIAAAREIDRLPQTDFRAKARVVLGRRCDAQGGIRVREYTYHPEYVKDSYSALAAIQLETDYVTIELRPICQPPAHFVEPQFFAMTLSENCKNPRVRIHRMKYVDIEKCKNFYRRTGLGYNSLWPRHAACARAVSGGRCVWRSGSVLAVKQDGRWRLLGFSVYGPGCGDPARFLDYGRYHRWVRLSSATVGHAAITRVADNHLIMRRSLANIQRYGPCDPEEKVEELYSDRVVLLYRVSRSEMRYNMSLYASVEYSCITLRATPFSKEEYEKMGEKPQPEGQYKGAVVKPVLPKIRLRRWCATSANMCYGFQHIEIQFYVEIQFSQSIDFSVYMYGKKAKVLSADGTMRYVNMNIGKYPDLLSYYDIVQTLKDFEYKSYMKWFYKRDLY